jgi:DNA-binding Lrp family transcriptional regulator
MDKKDLAIVTALEAKGGKVSTAELSKITGYPARTVRFRLTRLRENKALYKSTTMTHERRMGLAENIMVMKSTPKGSTILPEMFKALTPIYWTSSTYGTYDGFYVHALYSLTAPRIGRRILEEFQRHGLITDFFLFDITDYEEPAVNFSLYVPDEGWKMDWAAWSDKIEKNAKRKKPPKMKLEEFHSLVDFDEYDVEILLNIHGDATLSQKAIAENVGISEPQVKKRIQRMEHDGIIKGYRSGVWAHETTVEFTIFFEIDEANLGLIQSFYDLPFRRTLMMESRTRFGVRLGLQATDWEPFLQGVDRMRPYFRSFSFQTLHHRRSYLRDMTHPFKMYDPNTRRWETRASNYLEIIQKVLDENR